eukprot:TRINITY_DN83_c0_g1::TRINITY_DN83_c0_g1_i1::g.14789::m.14789 TRINITY_DN83_c0_g1::TRINITY_DN83_c0_g1_i1::g.14789  ORF type:complete len:366 (+),score=37.26,sp/O14717/TRDMT_HUMAN/39.44/6e-83,DNA_methylase/PF00145.12/2.3e-42 TRINITY_DN83_c0_g1_i1:54-1151(+)
MLTAIELFSGIGGFHAGLDQCGVEARVLSAFDINDVANRVYQYNYSSRVNPRNIASLGADFFDRLNADLWMLSPPCQPFTRNGLQKDVGDARTISFLQVLHDIKLMKNKPRYILLENVKGFETSEAHQQLVETVDSQGYHWQEFLLSPNQFTLPNQRQRLFFLAKLSEFTSPQYNRQLLRFIPESTYFDHLNLSSLSVEEIKDLNARLDERPHQREEQCKPLSHYLELLSGEELKPYLLTPAMIRKSGYLLDILDPSCHRSCCFTKSYTQYLEGTGSVICTQGTTKDLPSMEEIANNYTDAVADQLIAKQLRFFTPREILRLHGFPDSFQFPDATTLRQRYKLLGNSLNARVVSELLKYLLNNSH